MKAKRHFSDSELERLDRASDIFAEIGKSIGILNSINWGGDVADRFFEKDGKEYPDPVYQPVETAPVWELLAKSKELINGNSEVHEWLGRIYYSFCEATRLIETRGTAEFFEHSKNIYGTPSSVFHDGKTSALNLAQSLDQQFDLFCMRSLAGENYGRHYTAEEVRDYMLPRVREHFGDNAPVIEISNEISAKALATTNIIKLRSGAYFSDLDGPQLLLHEAHVHIATTLNGRAHKKFKVLGTAHALTTKTQEGLCVFSEMMGGAIDPFRMRRLTNRVLAVQMAIDGADFLDVYNDFYLERSKNEREAYESTRRIFRGGTLTGGAPFTKDAIYLEGLARVHNYLRVSIPTGQLNYPNYLFYGKLDLDDIPALKMLDEQQLLTFPQYRPPWMEDMRFLATIISYQSFLEKMDFPAIQEAYKDVII